jgi:hypothetical protein
VCRGAFRPADQMCYTTGKAYAGRIPGTPAHPLHSIQTQQ